ncbi:hypothetical protein CARUB_v10021352mg [Capsella rubella]|uniref:Phosphatidylinositol N-acetylglucosaminyltransferase subunit P n=1 Tax=Capsella rubella TaxID=81985 RepID=R0I714_9BRAS|nr:phosphatidylinositol N-acetylglucosaminyltransferase subunit P [Capsella rubella]EOA33860.1 hypothetical protein CARUB_v10021352mg [Capsella rubella]
MEEEADLAKSPRRNLRRIKGDGMQDSEMISKPYEVYGFVGSILTVVATVIFLIWGYAPEMLLESLGISHYYYYYPNKYWALAMPLYLMVTLFLVLGFYIGLNFMSTSSPTSFYTLFDEYSTEDGDFVHLVKKEEDKPIDPISDIDITRANVLMFDSRHAK